MPNILQKDDTKLDNDEWLEIFKGINTAVDELIQYRLVEGNKLEKDVILRINLIIDFLEEITPYAKARIERVKENLLNKISHLKTDSQLSTAGAMLAMEVQSIFPSYLNVIISIQNIKQKIFIESFSNTFRQMKMEDYEKIGYEFTKTDNLFPKQMIANSYSLFASI